MDAAATAAMALLFLGFGSWISGTFAMPAGLLRGAGWLLAGFALALAGVGSRRQPPPPLVGMLVVGNALWVLASVLLLATSWLTPNALGIVFVLAQAAAVAVFTALEFAGMRAGRREATSRP